MANKTLCMGCMSPLKEGDSKCARCGYPVGGVNPPEYMRVRTVLGERYMVGRVLEVTGDSAVYIGLDRQDESTVTIREFFPSNLAQRDDNGFLKVVGGCEGTFAAYKQKFLTCARATARLRDVLVVVPSFDIFEENGTAYSVSEYCPGVTLERYVREKGTLSYEQVRRLFLPLISAMTTIHAAGILHLGICPKNVLVDAEGHLRLKNFCIPETHTVNTECKPGLISGYSAPEQYEAGVECTETADVYGLAATMYFALTGAPPMDAPQRAKKNNELLMPADVADTLPEHVKESLHRAMRTSAEHRTRSAQQLLDELTATSAVAALIDDDDEDDAPRKPAKKKSGRSWLWLIFVGVVLALAILAVFALAGLGYIDFGSTPTTTTASTSNNLVLKPTTTVPIVTKPTGSATVAVENLSGRNFDELLTATLAGNMTVRLQGYQFSDQPAGTVLAQSPEPNTQAERGSEIAVIISAGPAEKVVPDLTGWKEEHARLYLEALGFKVGDTMLLQVSTMEKGLVEKTTPAAGEPIKVGDTVQLWVSNVDQSISDDDPYNDPYEDPSYDMTE